MHMLEIFRFWRLVVSLQTFNILGRCPHVNWCKEAVKLHRTFICKCEKNVSLNPFRSFFPVEEEFHGVRTSLKGILKGYETSRWVKLSMIPIVPRGLNCTS
jgi:hypothetical protein